MDKNIIRKEIGVEIGKETEIGAGKEIVKSNDPLSGITLKMIVEFLFKKYGWDQLGKIIKIKCFNENPSINSSLTFLRKTPWARKQAEDLYLSIINKKDGRER